MAGNQLNNIQLLDLTTGLLRTPETGLTPDVIQLETDFELLSGANLLVDGNLTVNGTTTTVHSEQVNIRDNHLYLNADYTVASAQTGGLVINVLPTGTTDTVNGAFTAGVAATSNPTVVTTGSATFSPGDIIQISGANDQTNDGVFEVESHVGTLLTIRGVGTVATTQSWFANQFATDSVVAGTITVVNVNTLQGTSTGTWQTFTGNTSNGLTYQDFTTQGTVDLQEAYEQGNTITTTALDGSVIVAGTEALQVTATGGLDVNTQFDFDGTVFDVLMTGSNGFSIDGTAASNVSVDAGDLSLATTTSGSLLLDGVDGVEINSTGGALSIGNDADAQAINIGTGAAARTITMGNATGATALALNSGTGALAFSSTVAETSALATLTTTGTNGDSVGFYVGESDPSAAAGVVADVGSLFFRDSAGAGTTGELWLKSGAANTAWTQVQAGAGNSLQQAYEQGNTIVTDATNGAFDVSGTQAISLDASLASNFTVDNANLTLSTTTAGDVLVVAADTADISGTDVALAASSSFTIEGVDPSSVTVSAGGLALEAQGGGLVEVDGDGGVNVESASGAINIGADAVAQAINIGTGAAARTLTMGNATGATQINFDAGTGAYTFDSTVDQVTALFTSTTSGTGGDSYSTFVGGLDPSAAAGVAAPVGSLYHRDVGNAGTGGELYLKTGVAATAWQQVQAGAGNSLQQAYEVGNTIVTDTTNGAFDVSGTEAISLDAQAASNFTVDGALLTLSTTTSGNVELSAATNLVGTGGNVGFTASTGTASLVATAGEVDITAGTLVDINGATMEADLTGGVSIDAGAASNFTVDGAELAIGTTTSGELDLTSAGLMDVNAGANLDIDVTGTFDMLSTGAFSIDGTGASNVSADAGDLALSTTTSGSVLMDGVDGVELNSTGGAINIGNDADAQAINLGTGAAARTITVGNATGATAVDFDAGTGAYSFDSTVGGSAALFNLSTTGTDGDAVEWYVSDLDPSAAAGIAAPVGSTLWRDSGGAGTTGELWLKTGAADTAWEQVATGNTGETLQQAYENGNTIVTDTTNGDFDVSGTEAISLDAGAASNFTVDSADLTLSTTTSGELDLTSAGLMDINAGANFDLDVTGTMDLDSTGAFSIDGTGASNVTADSGNLTLSTTTSGTLDMTSAADIQMTFATNTASAMVIDDGTNDFMTFDSTTGSLAVEVNQFLDIVGSGAGITLTAGTTITAGQLVTIEDTTGDVILADSNTGTTIDGLCIGIAAEGGTATNPIKVYTVPGALVQVTFGAAPAAVRNGDPVYVSQTAGQATLTAPTGSGNVVYVVGILQGADGVTTSPTVVYQPQFISVRP